MKTIILLSSLFLISLLACNDDSQESDNCLKADSCYLEPETGPCFALINGYYYDQEEKKCKEFLWGGCGGVRPFATIEECLECECNEGTTE